MSMCAQQRIHGKELHYQHGNKFENVLKSLLGIIAKRRQTPPPADYPTIVTIDAKSGNNSTVHTLTGVPAGALLVLTTQVETDLSGCAVSSTPTLTWIKRADAQADNSGDAEVYTAIFTTGGNITVTSDWSGVGQSSTLYVITGAESVLNGANALNSSQSAPSTGITTTRNNSIIIGVISDWNAVNGSSRVYTGSPTEANYFFSSNSTTGYHFYKQAPTVGSYTIGLSSPTGQSAGTALLEIRKNITGPDTEPPTAPTLSLGSVASTSINLSWTASTDNVGVAGYDVYVDSVYNGTTSDTIYTVTGLTQSTTYSIYVVAKDGASNSAQSNTITPTTSVSGGPRQNLVWDKGFEGTDPFAGWTNNQSCCSHSVTASTTIFNEGSKSFRAEVRQNDPSVSSGFRAELTGTPNDTGEMWYGWSMYIQQSGGGNWNPGCCGHIVQWHPDNGSGSASLAIWGDDGVWDVTRNPLGTGSVTHQTTKFGGGALTPIVTNTWHHIVFHVKWNGTTGSPGSQLVEMWLNGELYAQYTSGVNFGNGPGQYFKLGMNRWNMTSTWIIYYDNVRIGNNLATYNDVAPIQI